MRAISYSNSINKSYIIQAFFVNFVCKKCTSKYLKIGRLFGLKIIDLFAQQMQSVNEQSYTFSEEKNMVFPPEIAIVFQLAPSVAIIAITIWSPFKKWNAIAYILYFAWALPTLWQLMHL